MKIFNFGSLNLDHVYTVNRFVGPGETMATQHYRLFVGGKGLNQSIALSRAGAEVKHAGLIGNDGLPLLQMLKNDGVNTKFIETTAGPSGHAIIQVNDKGENCILIHGGANHSFTEAFIEKVLKEARPGDIVLVQNEINDVPAVIRMAKALKLKVVFNVAPYTEAVLTYPLELVDLFIVNRLEGQMLSGEKSDEHILSTLSKRYPHAAFVLTLGSEGVRYADATQRMSVPAIKAKAKDTTGAGDTFTGFFLAGLTCGLGIEQALRQGCAAAAICIQRDGAAASIPLLEELKTTEPA